MRTVTLKQYVPKDSLSAKLKGMDPSSFATIPYNSSRQYFYLGPMDEPTEIFAATRVDPKDINSEMTAPVPGTNIVLSDRNFHVEVKNGKTLDLSNPNDAFMLKVLMNSGWIAKNKRVLNPNEGHKFIMEDPELDAEETSVKVDKVYDAVSLLREMSVEEKRDLCRLMGQYTNKMNEKKIDGFLKGRAQSDPDEIINLLEHKDYKYRVFLKRLQDAGVIRVEDGKYFYGETIVGIDQDTAVFYLRDQRNKDVIDQWGRFLNKDGTVDIAKEVVEKTIPSRKK
jgi:hypothetical protein